VIDELLFYLPGTADNLLFLTLAVLVLLMITGIYGFLSTHSEAPDATAPPLRWGWPALSVFALAVLFFWFGQPLTDELGSHPKEIVILVSQFLTGLIVLSSAAAAVLSSDLKWSLTAATISFLTSGLLFIQADMLPLVLLCWLILGGSVLLFLYYGVSNQRERTNVIDQEHPFREPFLSCLACGLLLCGCLWVVHREWGPTSTHTITEKKTAAVAETGLVQTILTEHWPTFILLTLFVAVSFVGISRLITDPSATDFTIQDDHGEFH